MFRKGKAGKPNEFGKLVLVQEAENQIVTHYEVFEERPSDSPSVAVGGGSATEEVGTRAATGRRRCRFLVPGARSRGAGPGRETCFRAQPEHTKCSATQLEKQRWFKQGQKWRTGCEGRITVLKRRHGLARSRYHGSDGMRRWVGLGIIADDLINMGRWLVLPQPA
jgi:IS5 family transposase